MYDASKIFHVCLLLFANNSSTEKKSIKLQFQTECDTIVMFLITEFSKILKIIIVVVYID
jgi:hypothetical protein